MGAELSIDDGIQLMLATLSTSGKLAALQGNQDFQLLCMMRIKA